MSKIVEVNDEGKIVYHGMLSSADKATADDLIRTLKEEIPQIEDDLKVKYGNTVWYRYNLGKILGELLERFEIPLYEQRKFWDEIKMVASKEERVRDEGKNSVTRSFYQQCYVLSGLNEKTVGKLSSRQWQDLLDRVSNREDERIFLWIEQYTDKIREDDWREFEKALNMYLKKKDTSVFNEKELFEIYDSLMTMAQQWRIMLKEYEKEKPSSQKIKNKSSWSKKYMKGCFQLSREKYCLIDENICNTVFKEIMYNQS